MSANLVVVNGADKIVTKTEEGAGSFSDLAGSTESAKSPIVAGIWEVLDIDEATPAWEAEWDEVKYVIAGMIDSFQTFTSSMLMMFHQGELVLKNELNGEVHTLSAGSLLWIPKGAKMSIIRSKGTRTIYVEQTYRPVSF
ncbi:hypothetical protein N7451_000218 [Penicillium sp. IBT 35674x]|nr:hypothetical protein N7451_000218 [Penicillium sp. IBT 35674x]